MAPTRIAATNVRTIFCWTSLFCMDAIRLRAAPKDPDVSATWPRMDWIVSRFRPSSCVMSMAVCSVSCAISSAPRTKSFCCWRRSFAPTRRPRDCADAFSGFRTPSTFSRSISSRASVKRARAVLRRAFNGAWRSDKAALASPPDRASTSSCLLRSLAASSRLFKSFARASRVSFSLDAARQPSFVSAWSRTSVSSDSYWSNMASRRWLRGREGRARSASA
mmetsp:Transcript_18750/g.57762  ORF Transcript_18750/g.57762 Transcript_18750/m.57762 type:complete len:221 (-) Transcript_18750:172-834(-)